MAKTKQERYEELCEKDENMTDEEITESVQLFYELDPNRQYWREHAPDMTPQSIWKVDTSCYNK